MEMMAPLRRQLLLQLGSMGTQALPHPYLIAEFLARTLLREQLWPANNLNSDY